MVPDRILSEALGLISDETVSSPEWLLGLPSDLLPNWVLLETDPEEPELEVEVVAPPPLLLTPLTELRVINGETGEPRSRSLESGLFLVPSLLLLQLTESRKRAVSESRPGSLPVWGIFSLNWVVSVD